MKKINNKEYKQTLLEIFSFFNDVCRKNDIKYSLIGGSLIGAVRHHGIIPWDDDIDVVLMPDEYEKLMFILKNNKMNSRYKLFDYNTPGYYIYFPKLIDTTTKVIEGNNKIIPNYGIYIDIFRYNYIPEKKVKRKIYELIFKYKIRIIRGFACNNINPNLILKIRNYISSKKNVYNYILKWEKFLNKNNKNISSKMITNNPVYGDKKEIQESKNFEQYIDIDFDGINAMIFKNYDKILTTTFGDYMKLPPEKDRKAHHNIRAWKK